MKPVIAIASYIYGDSAPSPHYFCSVERNGGFPLGLGTVVRNELPLMLETFHGLLLTGGMDIDPVFFNQPLHRETQPCARQRDETELLLAKAFLEAGKPILAICRGVQVLNVALGGDLIQHVFDLETTTIAHNCKDTRHGVLVEEGSLLSSIFPGQTKLTVNSTHHQALGRIAEPLRICARSEDGLVEAVEHGNRVLGVQWHPERLLDEGMGPIFSWFIQAAAATLK